MIDLRTVISDNGHVDVGLSVGRSRLLLVFSSTFRRPIFCGFCGLFCFPPGQHFAAKQMGAFFSSWTGATEMSTELVVYSPSAVALWERQDFWITVLIAAEALFRERGRVPDPVVLDVREVPPDRTLFQVKYQDGWTELITAAFNGDLRSMERHIRAGADVQAATNDGGTALMACVANGHIDVAELLIRAGAGVNASSKNGSTSLMIASANGHNESLDALLRAGANPSDRNEAGWTALMHACARGFRECALILIREGADIQAKNGKGGGKVQALQLLPVATRGRRRDWAL
eukprot:m.30768 g.30768  ORF g.30768 m.30768 type:complete len:290 (+) comp41353_c0_seq1:88-957(+)